MLTVRKIVASAAVAALITTGSSAAIAQTSAPARATTQQSTNPWVTLSMLTPVSASMLGSATTAAQPTNDQGQPQGIGGIPTEVLIGWLAMLILIIYLGTKGNGHHHANSPA